MYHRIAEERFDPWALAVPPHRFREQLTFLKSHRTIVPLPEMVERARSGRLPADAVAITFDDGYACNLGAAEALRQASAVATIFVTVDNVRSGREYWWDELERLVLGSEARHLRLVAPAGEVDIDLGDREADDREWPPSTPPRTARQKAFHEIWSRLRLLEPGQQQDAMAHIRESAKLDTRVRSSHRPMCAAEVGSLSSFGVEVGAHSMTHTSLSARSEEDQRAEIYGSREQCAQMSGARVRSFAYPYGDFDERSERLVEEAGFACACTTKHGAVRVPPDAFALPRIQVRNWTTEELARVLSCA
jgi:peptidoglycan/xylan/chitin deacetylase (PgdA/CDA1 family)